MKPNASSSAEELATAASIVTGSTKANAATLKMGEREEVKVNSNNRLHRPM